MVAAKTQGLDSGLHGEPRLPGRIIAALVGGFMNSIDDLLRTWDAELSYTVCIAATNAALPVSNFIQATGFSIPASFVTGHGETNITERGRRHRCFASH